jgi:hypothetical protein
MVTPNKEEIVKVKIRITQLLARDRDLKSKLKKNKKDLESAEIYLASLLGKSVKEITKVKSITDWLEDILRRKGLAMKAQELLEEIQLIPGLEKTNLPTVTTALIRNSNKARRFKKVAPNTYELLTKEEGNM